MTVAAERQAAQEQVKTMTMVAAVNDALRVALERDDKVMLFGEDVGMGGVFRASDNLQNLFGEERVFNTPLSEAGIMGLAVGLGIAGEKPIAELQFAGFIYPALEQINAQIGRYRQRTQGNFPLSMVVRAPYGGGIHSPEMHADSPEGLVAAVPGVKIVIPSTPYDAKGLLLAAVDDPDPVFFFESIKLYRSVKGEVPTGHYTVPLGKARIAREGDDCTVLCYGGMVEVCEEAAVAAAAAGVNVEVVDLRSIVPLDFETISESVKKTGRVVIVHEAARRMGFGAELSARIAEELIEYLHAPITRVTGWDAPYPPFTAAEHMYRPDAARVAAGIRKVLDY
ncbi:alpha-ketoacid dehydrogenase subunit beta [Deinococcus detaillensis]|nr:alpha-ketoacid dehydrogenase subunit beta [Deinococcus detaillensis]